MTGLKQRGEILIERMLISYWRRRAPVTTPTPPFLDRARRQPADVT